MTHTLLAFNKGSKNDDLKSVMALPSEVPLHSATKQCIKITFNKLQLALEGMWEGR
jgi:hypothetical protein